MRIPQWLLENLGAFLLGLLIGAALILLVYPL